ncbi:MAG: ATP-binding protein [Lachnospiraceae bacterium]|nr:ATP-binding protein [Lachnospiraceae bacterium]
MARTVGIGKQNYEKIVINNNFYIDKTLFIKEWWENDDEVTLITRPRRFGKTLNISMIEQFFSIEYAGRSDLFEGMNIWKEEKYRKLQGSYPVISLSFANIKESDYTTARKKICQMLVDLYANYTFLLDSEVLAQGDKDFFRRICVNMDDADATLAIHYLSKYLNLYYGKKVIILLDEYDTPMQEAYTYGYWEKLVNFTKGIFQAAFKTNPWLERAMMTGITRISKESIFSDLNNLEVVTTTSEKYADSFGFTQEEVFDSLEEFGLSGKKQDVKNWYDGFTFGTRSDIYNPWSILNFLDKKKFATYWANTSSNSLVGRLIRESNKKIKQDFESLMRGECIKAVIDEQIIYDQLLVKKGAIWSFLLAGGYLKVAGTEFLEQAGHLYYQLALTNKEVHIMFEDMIHGWFESEDDNYNDFIRALLENDVKAMNIYMNKIALATFSYFDTGKEPSKSEPERFYHGFVLGLIVELRDKYVIKSNRESGFGRYDVILEPRKWNAYDVIIMEFKVQDTEEEKELSDTVEEALRQIERQNYAETFIEKGIPKEHIRKYGFAFSGKRVLIGKA